MIGFEGLNAVPPALYPEVIEGTNCLVECLQISSCRQLRQRECGQLMSCLGGLAGAYCSLHLGHRYSLFVIITVN